jgi:hypothetical protein
MDRILGESLRETVEEGLAMLGGPPSMATVHQPLTCAQTVRAELWQPQR